MTDFNTKPRRAWVRAMQNCPHPVPWAELVYALVAAWAILGTVCALLALWHGGGR